MRNRLFLFVFLSLLASSAKAQSYIGFKGGMNYSKTHLIFNIEPKDLVRRSNFAGFYISIPASIKINDIFSFQPELVFTTEGSVFTVFRPEEERIYENLLYYLKIPLLAKITLLQEDAYQVNVLGGITPAYAIGIQSTSYQKRIADTSRKEPASFSTTNTNRFNLALNAGASLEKTIAKDLKIVLSAQYNLGIFDIDTTSDRTSFTEGIYVGLGLMVPLGGTQ